MKEQVTALATGAAPQGPSERLCGMDLEFSHRQVRKLGSFSQGHSWGVEAPTLPARALPGDTGSPLAGWQLTAGAVLLPAPKPWSPRRREETDSALTQVVSGRPHTSRERRPPTLLSGCSRRILAPKSSVMLAPLHAQLLSSLGLPSGWCLC